MFLLAGNGNNILPVLNNSPIDRLDSFQTNNLNLPINRTNSWYKKNEALDNESLKHESENGNIIKSFIFYSILNLTKFN